MLVPVGAPMGLVVGWMRTAGRHLYRWLATARRMARVWRVQGTMEAPVLGPGSVVGTRVQQQQLQQGR